MFKPLFWQYKFTSSILLLVANIVMKVLFFLLHGLLFERLLTVSIRPRLEKEFSWYIYIYIYYTYIYIYICCSVPVWMFVCTSCCLMFFFGRLGRYSVFDQGQDGINCWKNLLLAEQLQWSRIQSKGHSFMNQDTWKQYYGVCSWNYHASRPKWKNNINQEYSRANTFNLWKPTSTLVELQHRLTGAGSLEQAAAAGAQGERANGWAERKCIVFIWGEVFNVLCTCGMWGSRHDRVLL